MSADAAPELVFERSRGTFSPRALTYLLDGGRENTEMREKFERIVESDSVFCKKTYFTETRSQRFRRALQKQRRIIEIAKTMGLSDRERRVLRKAVHDDLGTDLQTLMFIPNILATFSKDQQKYWLPKALAWEIIGGYLQTELGHGSNVRALETTATFLPDTDEIEINSPTLTSTKWWPGNLGRCANYGIVYARLILDGKDLGIHNFMVPLRSLQTHEPLPGIVIGDIGPKIGYNNQDNGFCKFSKVRIPRTNMAMAQVHLSKDGEYTAKPQRKQASYSTMTLVRASIVIDSGKALSAAATIAIRYSAVRKQGFTGKGDGQEMSVLDYAMQQARLFPVLASAFAFHFTGLSMSELLQSRSESPAQALALHIASSGLKALCSALTCDNIEICRKACGGHGYLLASGIPELLGTYKQAATVEGENFMIAQQTTRGLLKMKKSPLKTTHTKKVDTRRLLSELVSTDTAYVTQAEFVAVHSQNCATCLADVFDPSWQVKAYQQRSAWALVDLERKLEAAQARGMTAVEAWNAYCPDIVRASEAHCFYVMVRSFNQAVLKLENDGNPLSGVLREQCDLFALWWMQERAGDFFQSGFFSNTSHIAWIREGVRKRLASIRPNAVSLCDSWGHSDHMLHSVLGRHDGRVYEALWDSAQSDVNPMNTDFVDPVFEESLLPMRQFSKARL